MQSTSTFFSQVRARFNSGSCNSEGDKDVFLDNDQHFGSCFIIPPQKQSLKGILALLGFMELMIVKPRMTLGGCRMSLELRQFARNCLHCCKTIHSYNSDLDMQRYMVHTPFWLVLMV